MNDLTFLSSLKARGLHPWQANFVVSFLDTNSPPFQLLTGPVATGKMYSCLTIVGELAAQGAKRIMILAPSSICTFWGDLLSEAQLKLPVVLVTRQVYREMEASLPIGQSLWEVDGIYILSQDLAKQSDFVASLSAVTWDLLIVDEAHRMTSPLRRALLDKLLTAQATRRLLLLTPTPPPALETWMHALPGQPACVPAPLVVTNWYDVLKDWDGSPIEQQRVDLQVVPYTRGADEVQFLSQFLGLIPTLAVGVPKALQPIFTQTLTQRAASSSFAIEQSLQRLKHRLESQLNFTENDLHNPNKGQPEPEWEFEEVDLSNLNESDEWTAERTNGLPIVEELLEALDSVTSDEKLNAMKRLIRMLTDLPPENVPRICVISAYVDTLSYLHSAADDLGISSFKVTGESRFPERLATIKKFAEQGGLLIATDAGLEGVDIIEEIQIIHYDLPWSSITIDQRIGRFNRYDRKAPCTMYVLRDESGVIPVESAPIDHITSAYRTEIKS